MPIRNTAFYVLASAVLATTTAFAAADGGSNTEPDSKTLPQDRAANNTGSWSDEDNYWRDNYSTRSYYRNGATYETYQPAYRYGVDLYNRHPARPFEELDQSELERGWEEYDGRNNLNWNQARGAAEDSYKRLYNGRIN